MNLRKTLGLSAIVVALTGVSSISSLAQFANYSAKGNAFFKFDTATGKFFSTDSAGLSVKTINVNFFFDVPYGAIPSPATPTSSPIDATMLLTADSNGAATGTTFPAQKLKNFSIQFIGTSGAFLGKNLLTIKVDSTNKISGLKDKPSASLTGNTGSSDVLDYSSDFLNFQAGARTSNIALSLQGGALLQKGSTYLKSFLALGNSGSFTASSAPIPEASTLLGFGGMILGGGLMGLRRRRRSDTH